MKDETSMSTERRGDYVETYTGKHFYLRDPMVEDICLEDIAHALSLMPRFNGHTKEFYSVAAHSLHVEEMARRKLQGCGAYDPKALLACLLHDAAEAYVGDMVQPLKRSMDAYKAVERRIEAVILEAFSITPEDVPEFLKNLDNIALMTEAYHLMPSKGKSYSVPATPDLDWDFKVYEPKDNEHAFIERCRELQGQINGLSC